ncbi:hypothetical protein VNO78_20981 [Psophocarpus tetragonolobus]|uniref:Uncharacterized protein n=1 Tax=Psophocarpus tetragonolobus TaxID=3891 RepID=A0AAN9SEC7_PSOTE
MPTANHSCQVEHIQKRGPHQLLSRLRADELNPKGKFQSQNRTQTHLPTKHAASLNAPPLGSVWRWRVRACVSA